MECNVRCLSLALSISHCSLGQTFESKFEVKITKGKCAIYTVCSLVLGFTFDVPNRLLHLPVDGFALFVPLQATKMNIDG